MRAKIALPAILLAALLIRIAYIHGEAFPNDVSSFVEWSKTLATHPLRDFYATSGFADYPPLYYYVLWIIGHAGAAFFAGSGPDGALRTLVRIPAILADLLDTIFVFAIVRRYTTERWALIAAACFAFDPPIAYLSAYWGQVDSVPAAFALGSLYLMTNLQRTPAQRRPLLITGAWALLALSVLTKPAAVVLAVLYVVYAFATDDAQERTRRLTATLLGVVAAIAIAYVCSLPFHDVANPFAVLAWLCDRYRFGANAYPYTSVNAFNLHAVAFDRHFWVSDAAKFPTATFGLPENVWGIILFAIVLIAVSSRLLLCKDAVTLLEAAAIVALAYFTLLTRMHERYIYDAVVFMIPVACIVRRYRFALFTLSTTAYLNFTYTALYIYVLDYHVQGIDPNNLMPGFSHAVSLVNVALLIATLTISFGITERFRRP